MNEICIQQRQPQVGKKDLMTWNTKKKEVSKLLIYLVRLLLLLLLSIAISSIDNDQFTSLIIRDRCAHHHSRWISIIPNIIIHSDSSSQQTP